jgi:DNA-directed RNA polymerase sigma subunit (sigma70/sigma32)
LSPSDVDGLIEDYINLVISIAKTFNVTPDKMDELIQNGRIGLWKAIEKLDPEKGELSTFARQSIKWHIIKGLQKEKSTRTRLEDEVGYNSPFGLWEILPDTMTKLELEMISLRWEGYTIAEIGKKYNKSREWAGKTLTQIYRKIEEANEN